LRYQKNNDFSKGKYQDDGIWDDDFKGKRFQLGRVIERDEPAYEVN
jgi:hypothetical protein